MSEIQFSNIQGAFFGDGIDKTGILSRCSYHSELYTGDFGSAEQEGVSHAEVAVVRDKIVKHEMKYNKAFHVLGLQDMECSDRIPDDEELASSIGGTLEECDSRLLIQEAAKI